MQKEKTMIKRIMKMFTTTAVIFTIMCVFTGVGLFYMMENGTFHVYKSEEVYRIVRAEEPSHQHIHTYIKETVRSF